MNTFRPSEPLKLSEPERASERYFFYNSGTILEAASLPGISPQEPLKLSEPRKGIRTLILDHSGTMFGELPHLQEFHLESP